MKLIIRLAWNQDDAAARVVSAVRRRARALRHQATDQALALARWVRTRRIVCRVYEHPNAAVIARDYRLYTHCPDCGFISDGIEVSRVPYLRNKEDGLALHVPVGVDHQPEDGERRLLRAICRY